MHRRDPMTADTTRITKHQPDRDLPHDGVRAPACLVQIHGPEVGKRYVLDGESLTLGREDANDVVVDLDTVSRRHARVVVRGGRPVLEDLGSTNGTYLNDVEVAPESPLRSGDFLKVGGSVFKFLSGQDLESQYYETIYTLTIQDGLTGVHNRRFLMEYLEREMGRAQRYGRPLTLLLVDADHFKAINDTHGHLAGDAVLRELAQLVRRLVRREQCFARYGGEEFALAIPEDGPDKARGFAEKLRRLCEERVFLHEGQRIGVTVSIGVADLRPEHTEPGHLLKAADAALYRAKAAGRNRVCD